MSSASPTSGMGEEAILPRSEIKRGSIFLPVSAVLKIVEVDLRLSLLEVRNGLSTVCFFAAGALVAA